MESSDELDTSQGVARPHRRRHFAGAVIAVIAVMVVVTCGGLYISHTSGQSTAISQAMESVGKLRAATQVGTNYTTYGSLLIDAQAAVNHAEQMAPTSEATKKLRRIVNEYFDAASVWSEQASGSRTYFPDPGTLKRYNVLSPPLMEEYDRYRREFVEAMKVDPEEGTKALRKIRSFVAEHGLGPDPIMQRIWADASDQYKQLSDGD